MDNNLLQLTCQRPLDLGKPYQQLMGLLTQMQRNPLGLSCDVMADAAGSTNLGCDRLLLHTLSMADPMWVPEAEQLSPCGMSETSSMISYATSSSSPRHISRAKELLSLACSQRKQWLPTRTARQSDPAATKTSDVSRQLSRELSKHNK